MDIPYGIISTINLHTVSFSLQFCVCSLFMFLSWKIMGDYFSAEGYIMLDNENFPLSLLHFCNQSFISKICLINHHHAPFTYLKIGCCVLTSQSSRFLAHISAASQSFSESELPLPSRVQGTAILGVLFN